MKKPILFFGALCAISSAFAQDASAPAEKAASDVTMREGTFWSSYEVQGKVYSGGTWVAQEPAPADGISNGVYYANGVPANGIQPDGIHYTEGTPTNGNPGNGTYYVIGYPAAFDVTDPNITLAALYNWPDLWSNPVETFNNYIHSLEAARIENPEIQEQIDNGLWSFFESNRYSLPENTDWSGLNTTGKEYYGVPQSFTVAQLNAMTGFPYSQFTDKDLTGLNLTGKNAQQCDFRGATGINWSTTGYLDLLNSNLAGQDLSTWNPSGSRIAGCDLTNTNISGAAISNAYFGSEYESEYPQATNLSGLNLTGFDGSKVVNGWVWNVNFSNCTGLTASQFANVTYLARCNFSGTGITAQQLIDAGCTADLTDVTF